MSKKNLLPPIIFVGAPRSGTTVLFEAFAQHKKLGWPNDYTKKFPRHPIFGLALRLTNNAVINFNAHKNQYGKGSLLNKILPAPAEAYEFWDSHTAIDFSRQYLLGVKADQATKTRVIDAVAALLSYEGRQRFTAKTTGPSRIGYLTSIFPEAKFVHVVRDGRAVTDSLLNVDFWQRGGGCTSPWWKGGFTQDDMDVWQQSGKDPAVLTALQWCRILAATEQEAAQCGDDRFKVIKYEDFVASPNQKVSELFDWCQLEDCEAAHQYVAEQRLTNMNHKYQQRLAPASIQVVTEIVQPWLERFEYGFAQGQHA